MPDLLAHEIVGDGDPIVLLHGITASRTHWRPVVERLSVDHRCVNVDLLGHGATPAGSGYDVLTQAGAVGELIDGLGLDRPLLVGHSYGGFIATVCGATHPLRGVVNVDQELDTGAFKQRIAPFEPRLRSDDAGVFETAFDEFVATLRPDLVPEERRSLAAMRADQEIVLGVWETVFDTPTAELAAMIEPALDAYPIPYLAIFGDRISDAERRLLQRIPDVVIEEWEGLGHFVQLADPARTAERIAAFAASC
jgi:pimeloyl-ACP methyl ester carboxylesterase